LLSRANNLHQRILIILKYVSMSASVQQYQRESGEISLCQDCNRTKQLIVKEEETTIKIKKNKNLLRKSLDSARICIVFLNPWIQRLLLICIAVGDSIYYQEGRVPINRTYFYTCSQPKLVISYHKIVIS
jgi:hypothetical protein